MEKKDARYDLQTNTYKLLVKFHETYGDNICFDKLISNCETLRLIYEKYKDTIKNHNKHYELNEYGKMSESISKSSNEELGKVYLELIEFDTKIFNIDLNYFNELKKEVFILIDKAYMHFNNSIKQLLQSCSELEGLFDIEYLEKKGYIETLKIESLKKEIEYLNLNQIQLEIIKKSLEAIPNLEYIEVIEKIETNNGENLQAMIKYENILLPVGNNAINIEKLIEMRADGKSYNKICKKLHISKSNAIEIAKKYNREIESLKGLMVENLREKFHINSKKKLELLGKVALKLEKRISNIDIEDIDNMKLEKAVNLLLKIHTVFDKNENKHTIKSEKELKDNFNNLLELLEFT